MPSSQRSISTSRVRTRPVTSTLQSKKRAGSRTCPLPARSEEHTSELQSQSNLVCRLLLEKKNSEQRDPQAGRELTTDGHGGGPFVLERLHPDDGCQRHAYGESDDRRERVEPHLVGGFSR